MTLQEAEYWFRSALSSFDANVSKNGLLIHASENDPIFFKHEENFIGMRKEDDKIAIVLENHRTNFIVYLLYSQEAENGLQLTEIGLALSPPRQPGIEELEFATDFLESAIDFWTDGLFIQVFKPSPGEIHD